MKVIHWSSVYDGEDFEECPNCGVIGAPYEVLTFEGGKVKVCCPACKEAFLSNEKKGDKYQKLVLPHLNL